MSKRPITVALLAMPGVTAATLYGFHDCLCGVHRDGSMLHGGQAESPFRSLVVSRDGAPLVAANGVRIAPDASFETCGSPDVVCVTDIAVPPGEPLGNAYDAEVAWLRERHAQGAILASSCSGAESGDASIEAIAFEVGYRDASFFTRLFRRKVLMSPAQYRRRFGGLKTQLREAGRALGA